MTSNWARIMYAVENGYGVKIIQDEFWPECVTMYLIDKDGNVLYEAGGASVHTHVYKSGAPDLGGDTGGVWFKPENVRGPK